MSTTDSLADILTSIQGPPDLEDSSLKEPTETTLEQDTDVGDCPDGGLRAWLVVFGVVCGMCATVGLLNVWGTFQAYYEEVKLPHQSSSAIAWIGSIQNAMVFAPGLLYGRLFDMGHLRLPIFAASALFVACVFLTAECTQYWHFLLCQGTGIGLATGVFFSMGNMVMTHWFKKRLGVAISCSFGGAGIGGCIFPIIVRTLLHRVGFQWTMRVLGLVTLSLLLVSNLTIARRLPGTQNLGPLVNISEFRKPAYSFYVASLVINTLTIFTVSTYFIVSAVRAGIMADLSFYLLAIVFAVSALARLASGVQADLFGPLNVLIPVTVLGAAATFAWPFATNVASFVIIAVVIGIANGATLALLVQPFARMGPVSEVGLRIGMGMTAAALGVTTGAPMFGAILDATGSFKNVGYAGGCTTLLSAALMVAARHFLARTGDASPSGRV